MPRAIKLTLIALLVVGVICVIFMAGAILSLESYLNDPETRQDIFAQIEKETGRKITVEGPINLSFYPWLGVELNGVRVVNNTGDFGDKPLIRGDVISLRIKTLPLLKKRYEFDTLRLHDVEINLVKNSEGVGNWAVPVRDGGEEGERPSAKESVRLAAVVIGGVDIKDTHMTWHDRTTGRIVKITDVNMTTSVLSFSEPVDITMDLKIESNQPATVADLKMQGTATYDLDAETYVFHPLTAIAVLEGENIPNGKADAALTVGITFNPGEDTASIEGVTLDALGTQLTAAFDASGVKSGSPAIDGRLKVIGNDMVTWLKIFGTAQLARQVAPLKDRSFALNTDFQADIPTGDLTISTLRGHILGATIDGRIKAGNMDTRTPTFAGHLKTSAPDLPLLLQIASQFLGGEGDRLNHYGRRLSRLPDKRFKLAADFDADLKNGDIDLPALSVEGLGLGLNGKLMAENFGDGRGQMEGQFSLRGDNASAVLAAFDQGVPATIGKLGAISADTKISGQRGEITLDPLTFKVALTNPAVSDAPIPLTLTATPKMDLEARTVVVDDLRFDGLGIGVGAKINAELSDRAALSGEVRVDEFDLRKLMKRVQQKVPSTAHHAALGKVALHTHFSASSDDLEFKDLSFVLDDTTLRGGFAVKRFNQPAINFAFNADSINLDHYLPPKKKADKAGTARSKEAPPPWAALDALRKLNVVGELRLDKLVASNVSLDRFTLGVNAKEGIVKLDPIAADVYGGHHQGTVTLDARAQSAVLEHVMQLKDVPLGPLLKDFRQASEDILTGTANITAQLSTRGANLAAFKAGLNGKADLRVTRGVLQGIDVANTLRQAEIMIESKRLGKVDYGGETQFDQITGTLDIVSGVVKNTDLLMSAPGFTVGGGVNQKDTLADLKRNVIDYDLNIAVEEQSAKRGEEQYNIGGYQIPIRCRGSLESIASACKPDFAKLLGGAVKRAVVEEIGERIGIKLPGSRQPSAPEKEDAATPSNDEDRPEETPQEEDVLEQIKEGVLDKLF